jgi:hypothetical protein
MNITRTYKCTVCNKVKNIQNDPLRAIPNSCTITLGCTGSLNAFDTQGKIIKDSESDWVARGGDFQIAQASIIEETALMSASSNGALTIAVKMDDVTALDTPVLNVKFEQRRTESVKFTQFIYMTSTATNTISGKDSRGKNLRIDATAFSEGRVRAKVNGVQRNDFTVTPGQNASLQFETPIAALSNVDVFVYFEKEVEDKTVIFYANRTLVANSLSGAWGNLKWVYLPDKSTKSETKYWLYTATSVTMQPSSSIRLVEIIGAELQDVEFLLAKKPFSHFDRYYLGTVPATTVSNSFLILASNRTIRDFTIPNKFISSIFPTIKVYNNGEKASLMTSNTVYTDKGVLNADTIEQHLPKSNYLAGVT